MSRWTDLVTQEVTIPKSEGELTIILETRAWDGVPRVNGSFLESDYSATSPDWPACRVLLTCARVWPISGAHETPHGAVSGVAVLSVEAIPAACRHRHWARFRVLRTPPAPHRNPQTLPSRKSNHRRLPLDSFK